VPARSDPPQQCEWASTAQQAARGRLCWDPKTNGAINEPSTTENLQIRFRSSTSSLTVSGGAWVAAPASLPARFPFPGVVFIGSGQHPESAERPTLGRPGGHILRGREPLFEASRVATKLHTCVRASGRHAERRAAAGSPRSGWAAALRRRRRHAHLGAPAAVGRGQLDQPLQRQLRLLPAPAAVHHRSFVQLRRHAAGVHARRPYGEAELLRQRAPRARAVRPPPHALGGALPPAQARPAGLRLPGSRGPPVGRRHGALHRAAHLR
jgi:hypothetical protein